MRLGFASANELVILHRAFQRRRFALALFAVAGLVTAACAPTTSSPSSSNTVTEVTWWDQSSNTSAPAAAEVLAKQFNATHTDIQVKLTLVAQNDMPTKLATAIRAGAGPDLVGIDDNELASFATGGALEDISSKVRSLSFFQSLNKGQMASVTYKGHIYGTPEAVAGSIMFYNKTLFQQAGLNPDQPPTNFADYLIDAQKITALGGGKYGDYFAGNNPQLLAFTMLPMIYAAGSDLVSGPPENQTANVANNAALRATLQLYRDLWVQKLVPPSARAETGATYTAGFLAGKIGMLLFANNYASTIPANVPFSWGVASIPGPNGGTATYVGGGDFGILKSAKHKDAAWTVVQWALAAQQQVLLADQGYVPVRTDLLTPEFKAAYPIPALVMTGLKDGNLTLGTSANLIYHQIGGAWGIMVQKAIFDGQIDAAIQEGQQAYAQAIQQSSH